MTLSKSLSTLPGFDNAIACQEARDSTFHDRYGLS